jgi:hypothetical protein
MPKTTALASEHFDWRTELHPAFCHSRWGCGTHTAAPTEVRIGYGPATVVAAGMDAGNVFVSVVPGRRGDQPETRLTLPEADRYAEALLADAENSDSPLTAAASQALARALLDQIVRARTETDMAPGTPGVVAA